jgi:Ran GTPase-activating protein (RanGAP) involved in mRNA processing and transport
MVHVTEGLLSSRADRPRTKSVFGAETISSFINEVTHDRYLKVLDCSHNVSVKEKPAFLLGSVLAPLRGHAGVKTMKLTDCEIRDFHCEEIANILAVNKSIEKLVLDDNNLTAVGASVIAKALQTNQILKCINFRNQRTQITATFIDTFHVLLRDYNTTLVEITWDANFNQVHAINQLLQRNADIMKEGAAAALKTETNSVKLDLVEEARNTKKTTLVLGIPLSEEALEFDEEVEEDGGLFINTSTMESCTSEATRRNCRGSFLKALSSATISTPMSTKLSEDDEDDDPFIV